MEVKIKKLHPNAVIPTYSTEGAAGMDLTAVSWEFDDYGCKVYHTGLAFEIPKGYVGFVFPRSSNAEKSLLLRNCVGVIDSDYRGEVTLKFGTSLRVVNTLKTYIKLLLKKPILKKETIGVLNIWDNTDYEAGDRVGQIIIMPYPHIEFVEVDELSVTQRGAKGYGSTGR